ncbi:hypothetical protein [Kineosporia succinea]|uniref:HK97 gp10 family phage protein n=1 Tax=Kineosporia succinea TaxID=84632 RepID=A0ABT9NZ26_9ACTN|nr:hypothetical protein [Kineosporia succinea]MDP9825225.1 hypothetical protein [Kineosporia succinea]
MPRKGYVVKHSRAKSKIIGPLVPQIAAKAEKAVEEIRPTIARSQDEGPHLQDSLRVETKSWGAQVLFGNEDEYEKALSYEVGNTHQDGARPLQKIRQRIARS